MEKESNRYATPSSLRLHDKFLPGSYPQEIHKTFHQCLPHTTRARTFLRGHTTRPTPFTIAFLRRQRPHENRNNCGKNVDTTVQDFVTHDNQGTGRSPERNASTKAERRPYQRHGNPQTRQPNLLNTHHENNEQKPTSTSGYSSTHVTITVQAKCLECSLFFFEALGGTFDRTPRNIYDWAVEKSPNHTSQGDWEIFLQPSHRCCGV